MDLLNFLSMLTALLSLPPLTSNIFEIILFVVLVIIGLLIVIFIIKLLLIFLPAAIIAFVVWWLTGGSLFWAGIAFLVISVLSILRKI